MKARNYFYLALAVLLFAGCPPNPPEPTSTPESGGGAPPVVVPNFLEDELSRDSAIAWTTRWRDEGMLWFTSQGQVDMLKAFTIPNADFTQLFKEGADSIRAYLALDKDQTAHLVFVGVNAEGKDMLKPVDKIYDLSDPCPPLCDTSSVLFTGVPN